MVLYGVAWCSIACTEEARRRVVRGVALHDRGVARRGVAWRGMVWRGMVAQIRLTLIGISLGIRMVRVQAVTVVYVALHDRGVARCGMDRGVA